MNGNKNGFWTGQTGEGTGTVSDRDGNNPDVYTGQFTGWGGFGTNVGLNDQTGQMESGTTVTFHGEAKNGDTIDFHIDWHATLNNSGTPTAVTENFSCT